MMRILFTATVLAALLPVVAAAQSPEAWVGTESEVGTERGEILSRDDRPARVASSESAETAQRSQLQAWDLARQALLQHAPEGVPMSALELEWRGGSPRFTGDPNRERPMGDAQPGSSAAHGIDWSTTASSGISIREASKGRENDQSRMSQVA